MKKVLCIFLALTMVLLLAACATSSEGSSSGTGDSSASDNSASGDSSSDELPSGTFTMWAWDEAALTGCMDQLNEIYPDISCDYLNVTNEEILQKMQTTIASGMALPDLFWADGENRGKFQNMGILCDLEEEFGFDSSLIFDFLMPLSTDAEGNVVAIPSNCAVAGLSYQRDLAEQYLGTSDPDELEELLPDWDAFIEKGAEVYEASGGAVHMLPSATDAYQIISLQNSTSYVTDGAVDYTNALEPTLDVLFEMRDNNVFGDAEIWGTAWYASYAEPLYIFYPTATWSVRWQNESYSDPDGNWGLMQAPGGSFVWGGANWVITKDSEVKDAAWAYVEWFSLSPEGAEYMQEACSWYTPLKSMYEGDNLESYASTISEWFGDQDVGLKWWTDIAQDEINMRQVGEYDSVVNEIAQLIVKSIQSDDSFTSDMAKETFTSELGSRDSSLTVK